MTKSIRGINSKRDVNEYGERFLNKRWQLSHVAHKNFVNRTIEKILDDLGYNLKFTERKEAKSIAKRSKKRK